MIRTLITFIFFINASFSIYANSRDEIDHYNQETIELLSDLDSCLIRVDHTIERAENIGYDYGLAYAFYLKGYIHRIQDDLGKAFLANLKGLSLLQEIGDKRAPETMVRLYLNAGEILERHFKYDDAIKYYQEGLEVAKKQNLTQRIIDLSYNIGNAYHSKGDLTMAVNFIQESYKLAQSEGDEHTMVNGLNLMGLIFKDNYKYDTATFFFTKMLTHSYQDLDEDKYKGRAYHNLANTFTKAGDTLKAISTFNKSLEFKRKGNKPDEVFITENDLAELYYFQGDYVLAREIIERCIQNYDQMRLDPDYYKVFHLARRVNSAIGEYSSIDQYADRYFDENKKFIEQQRKLIEIRDQFKMEVLTASFFVELERNKRIAQLNQVILWISILSLMIIGYLKARQIWMKRVVGSAVRNLA